MKINLIYGYLFILLITSIIYYSLNKEQIENEEKMEFLTKFKSQSKTSMGVCYEPFHHKDYN